ncbi:hypothetical protein BBJ28_00016207 [Nothophytophthora sp. Chile5]|nr:hypothetical protein BBJ28_00016207 [Nothophytophthora sp. Chile5]
MDGYNATIFAYGQTSSGKTYTMEGANIDHPELRGIIPRTATEIFSNVLAADENMEFIVKVSYIEIYMERIRDLLDPYKSKVNLQVREDAQRGVFVEGMTEMCVTSDEELLATMRAGAANRAVAATGMNEGSSRSHSVFTVTLFQRNLVNQATKAGKLYLVDLAGSEMVRKTGATGRQLEEAKTINKSLSALGMVINALTDSHASHVPYRDSKLTRVLQESLGGNSRTALIINVSPSSYNAPETVSTLRFGMRAKSIKNKAVVNEQRSVEEYKVLLAAAEKQITKQQTHIIALEARLAGKEGVIGDGEGVEAVPVTITDDTQVGAEDKVGAVDVDLQFTDDAVSEAPRSPSARVGRALEELQEKVTQLEEELAEEKQESTRRGEEIRSLTAKLEEHIQALETQGVLSEELQRVKELQEKTLEEKIRQREALYSELRTDFDRLSYEHRELAIHSETIQSEYDALLQEMPSQAASSSGKLAVAARENAEQGDQQATKGEEKASVAPVEAASLGQVPADGAAQASSPADDTSITESPQDLAMKYSALEAKLKDYEKEYRVLKQTTEHEKARLQEDIERKATQIRDLEAQVGRVSAAVSEGSSPSPATSPSGSTVGSSGMSARERQHMRSIQQKLEQLVAVHRQLLRKYASLELELSEAKKKLALRDERIKQVEANNRIMAGNMRAQAEKHVEELTHLRDQIADFRGAQRSHFEAQLNHTNAVLAQAAGSDSSVIKTLRGGSFYSDGVIRPIRGGGRRKTAMSGVALATAGAGGLSSESLQAGAVETSAPSSGFLTRLFGKTG